jgi:lipid-A-disaccharide synthase-like uncharacterized protein
VRRYALILDIGFARQAFFFLRFFVRWLHSERHRRSLIPTAFWYLSLGWSSLLLVYGLMRRHIVFTVGQAAGFLFYTRNLVTYRPQPAGTVFNCP